MSYFSVLVFVYPILELWILFKFATVFGFWTTFFISIALVALGASLIVGQWQKMLTDFAKGEKLSIAYLLKYANKSLAGILIMLPGFISFVLGVLLLIPFTQKIISSLILKIFNIDASFQESSFSNYSDFQNNSYNPNNEVEQGRVIDGEIVEKKDSDENSDKRHS